MKADRMICRYVGRALGESAPVIPPRARALLTQAAQLLQAEHPALTPRLIDYALWERERSVIAA